MFSSKTLISFRLKKDMDILDDMGVSKLSAKVFLKSELLLKQTFTVSKHTFFSFSFLFYRLCD